MAFKHKYSFEEKERIVTEYINNTKGFRESCRIYGMSQELLKNWIRLYNTFEFAGLQTGSKGTHYSSDLKKSAVFDYLSKKMESPDKGYRRIRDDLERYH